MSYGMTHYHKNKNLGLCIDCGRKVESYRAGKNLCEKCNQKKTDRERRRRIGRGCLVTSWIPLWRGIYPSDDKQEILVTDVGGYVWTMDKGKNQSWRDRMDEDLVKAWRDYPAPYKGD